MKLIKILAIGVLFCFASCTTEPLEETNPSSQITQVGEYNITVSGTLDGESFSLNHISGLEKNYPVDGQAPRAHISNFSRKDEINDALAQDQIIIAITKSTTAGELLNTIFVGAYEWLDLADANPASSLAFLGDVRINGETYRTQIDPGQDSFNEFEIFSVTKLEADEFLNEAQRDKLYKVEGRLQVLVQENLQAPAKELIIDNFSLIFLND